MVQTTMDYERLATGDPEGFAEYLAEGRLWEPTSGDGLGDGRAEFPEHNR